MLTLLKQQTTGLFETHGIYKVSDYVGSTRVITLSASPGNATYIASTHILLPSIGPDIINRAIELMIGKTGKQNG